MECTVTAKEGEGMNLAMFLGGLGLVNLAMGWGGWVDGCDGCDDLRLLGVGRESPCPGLQKFDVFEA